MFSWTITGIFAVIGLGLIVFGIIERDDFEKMFLCHLVGIAIIGTLSIAIIQTWCYDFLQAPAHYQRINTNIQEIKQIITNKELNLADVEMNRELASLIKEKNELLTKVRINNISPFAYFKIRLEK